MFVRFKAIPQKTPHFIKSSRLSGEKVIFQNCKQFLAFLGVGQNFLRKNKLFSIVPRKNQQRASTWDTVQFEWIPFTCPSASTINSQLNSEKLLTTSFLIQRCLEINIYQPKNLYN
eukprot:TRINITY_DN1236_c1_g1_i10.p7 TRINITY_DN1236_c1_g1~~TRINITY_DN1236_c1_g1_i10.p7  ORF type:complete len:116 (+),score=1.76 TRINITY_DN1236_c1_g1_i10:857-1204(+)